MGGVYVLDVLAPTPLAAVRGRLVPSLSPAVRRSLRLEEGGRSVGVDVGWGSSLLVDGPASARSSANGTTLGGSTGCETRPVGGGVDCVTAALRLSLALR